MGDMLTMYLEITEYLRKIVCGKITKKFIINPAIFATAISFASNVLIINF